MIFNDQEFLQRKDGFRRLSFEYMVKTAIALSVTAGAVSTGMIMDSTTLVVISIIAGTAVLLRVGGRWNFYRGLAMAMDDFDVLEAGLENMGIERRKDRMTEKQINKEKI